MTRNAILDVTYTLVGTVVYQSRGLGSNTFHRQVVLNQPLLFNSGPKIQRTNDNSLEFCSGNNNSYKAMTLQGDDGHVVCHIGFHNDSDISLKDKVENANLDACYKLLKNVDAKTLTRNDIGK